MDFVDDDGESDPEEVARITQIRSCMSMNDLRAAGDISNDEDEPDHLGFVALFNILISIKNICV